MLKNTPFNTTRESTFSRIGITISILLISFFYMNTKGYTQSDDHIKYWRLYYSMEESVIDSNYTKALEYYHDLYQQYEFIYANHAFIGLQLCAINSEKQNIQKYIERCYQAGILEEVLKNNSIIKKHIPNIEKYDINYDSLRAVYKGRINLKIREEIIRMDSLDNIATDKVNKSFLNYSEWRKVSRKNAKRIFEITEAYGYPGEKLIGINQNQQFIDSIGDYKIGWNILNQSYRATNMLVHYFSSYSRACHKKNMILLKQVKQGYLEPTDYGIFHDFQARWKFTGQNKECYYNVWHIDPHKRTDEINSRRLNIGLKITDYQSKRREYIFKNRKQGFTNIYIDYF